MGKEAYLINGVTIELAEKWMNNFRDDLMFRADKKTGDLQVRVYLSWIEAIGMRFQIFMYNLTHKNKFNLKKYKGERYRA